MSQKVSIQNDTAALMCTSRSYYKAYVRTEYLYISYFNHANQQNVVLYSLLCEMHNMQIPAEETLQLCCAVRLFRKANIQYLQWNLHM